MDNCPKSSIPSTLISRSASNSDTSNVFTLNGMMMKDGETGKLLWESTEDMSKSDKEYSATIPKTILNCKSVSRELNFSSKIALNNFSLKQKIYFHDQLMEEWNFNFGFVIPGSTNSWENTIEAVETDQMLPAEILSGNIVIRTEFYGNNRLIATSAVRIFYN